MGKAKSDKKKSNGYEPYKTHPQLDKLFRDIGERLAAAADGSHVSFEVPNPDGHKDDIFKIVLGDSKFREKDKFGDKYRSLYDKQDELISTSAVRELINGILQYHDKNPLSPAKKEQLNTLINNISRIRLPTNFSGSALEGGNVTQHPTSYEEAIFSGVATASRHSRIDRERKNFVENSMTTEMSKSAWTVEGVFKEAIRAAITFTLNKFTAPITAENVFKYARSGISAEVLQRQIYLRDYLKKLAVNLFGAEQLSDPVLNPQREWDTTKAADGALSPNRNSQKTIDAMPLGRNDQMSLKMVPPLPKNLFDNDDPVILSSQAPNVPRPSAFGGGKTNISDASQANILPI